MIWRAWRARSEPAADAVTDDSFGDLLEGAPVMALLIDRHERVLAANAEARTYFQIDPSRLPAGVVEVTREGGLLEQLRLGEPDGQTRLVHRGRFVRTRVVPGPNPGDTLLYLADVTDLTRLQTVRQEFVANLAHELKTPLTSLRLAVESVAEAPPEARQRFVERALREADQLSAIVDNLRQLTEIESGQLRLNRQAIAIRRLLQEVASRAAPRSVAIEAPEGLTVNADRSKLAQALGNLVENAVKFSPPDSGVELSAETTADEVLIHVRDHGAGISPEHWDRVFERFYKVDPGRRRRRPDLLRRPTCLNTRITRH